MFDNLIFRYGTVTGPGTSTNNALVLWDGTSGTLIKNSTVTIPASGALGDVVGPASSTNNTVVLWNGTSGRLLKNGTLTLPTTAIVGIGDTQALTNKSLKTADNTTSWAGAGAKLEVSSTPASEASGGTGGAFMSFHRAGAFALHLGLDANNVFKISGWSLGTSVPWSVTSIGVMQVYRTVYFGMYNSVIANTAATTIDFSLGQKAHLTLQASTTISCNFPGVGNYQILIAQDATGNRTITWGAGITPMYVGSVSAPAINLGAYTATLVSIYWSSSNAFIAVSKVNAA